MTRTDPSTIDPMSDGYFKALIKELLETKEDAITQLQAMRLASHKQYFSVAQVRARTSKRNIRSLSLTNENPDSYLPTLTSHEGCGTRWLSSWTC